MVCGLRANPVGHDISLRNACIGRVSIRAAIVSIEGSRMAAAMDRKPLSGRRMIHDASRGIRGLFRARVWQV